MIDVCYEDFFPVESLDDKKKLINDVYYTFSIFQESVMEEISKRDNIEIDSLEIIDSYLNMRNCLNEGVYYLGDRRINLKDEHRYFEKDEQEMDYINDMFPDYVYPYLDELRMIEDLMNDEDDYIELLCLFVKWVLVKDNDVLNKLIDYMDSRAFFCKFVTSKPENFWMSKYDVLISEGIDERIFKDVAFIDHFYWSNKKYIKDFLIKVKKEKISYDDLESMFNFGNIIERKIFSLKFYMDYGKWNYLPIHEENSLNITKDEAKQIYEDKELFRAYLDNLTEEEKCGTGYFALFQMIESIESLNILRLILFELINENRNYRKVYRIIDDVLNDFFEIYIHELDIADVTNSETIYYKLSESIKIELKEVYEQMIKAISDVNLNDLMKAKKRLILYYKFCEPNNYDEIERRVDSIYQRLIDSISKEEKYKLFMENIIDSINERLKDKITQNNKILSTLATAELLYDEYIRKGSIIDNFDYSLISCGYYKSIELLTNLLFYEPYSVYDGWREPLCSLYESHHQTAS